MLSVRLCKTSLLPGLPETPPLTTLGMLQGSSALTEVWGTAGSDTPSESVLLNDSGVGLPHGDPE